MIRLPDTPLIRSTGINAPGVSADAAAAPARALQNVAGAIGNTAAQFVKLGNDLARVDNARKLSETRQRLASEYAKFQIDLQNETDPQARITKTEQFLASQKNSLSDNSYPPELREQLDTHFTDYSTRAKITGAQDAASLTRKRASLAFENELDAAAQSLDRDRFYTALDTADAALGLLPEQRQQMEREFEDNIRKQETTNAILADPLEWLNNNPEPTEGQSLAEFTQFKDMANRQQAKENAEDSDTIKDLIVSGDITTPEDIDEKAAHLRPPAREALKSFLYQRADAAYQEKLNSPEFQQQLIGQASEMLRNYSPTGEGMDGEYVKIDSILRDIKDPAMRDELKKNLTEKRAEEASRIKSHGEQAADALNDHYDALAKKLPSATSDFSTTRAINDGFLRDTDKLQSLGFSEEQVDTIIGGTNDKDSERKQRFQQEWTKRSAENTAPGFTTATAEAILDSSTKISFTDPEREDAQIQAALDLRTSRGKALSELQNWLANEGSNATPDQIEQQIFKIAGADARKKFEDNFFDSPKENTAAPKGADPSTSALPIGNDLSTVVKHFEAGGAKGGFHRTAYWDYGQWSIGYGTKSKKGEIIDKAEAERRLASELSSHRTRVEAEATRLGIRFTPNEMDALTSFDYNTGSIAKLLANGSRTKSEVADIMLLYRNADGERLAGLERRRAAERHIFLHGYTAQAPEPSPEQDSNPDLPEMDTGYIPPELPHASNS